MRKIFITAATAMLLAAPLVLRAQDGARKQSRKTSDTETGSASQPVKDLAGNDMTQTLTCNGEAITITGNDNTITIEGKCSKVTLVGNDNKVLIGDVKAIKVTGNDNEVSYKSSPNKEGKARIIAEGSDNNIAIED